MQQKDNNLKKLQQRISSGQATEAEKQRYAQWLNKLNIPEEELSYQDIESRRVHFQQRFYQYQITKGKQRQLYRWLPAVAAAVLIFATATWFLIGGGQIATIKYTEIEAGNGQRKIVTLPDGSTVTLNNASQIRFPQSFASNIREVSLNGEAFFDVEHETERPFIVKTNTMKIQVLGTSFDVRSYRADPTVAVTVATGKVGVSTQGKKAARMLTPGRQLTYHLLNRTAVITTVNPADYTSWQQGKLVFKNETLEGVCKRMERYYGVRIIIKTPALNKERYTMTLRNEALQKIMELISITGEFQYEIKGKVITLWKN